MNTSFNEDEFNKLINTVATSWGSFGISAEEAGKAINNLTAKLNEFNKTASCDTYEIRGGKGNKKMAMLRPRAGVETESSNRKYDLEIFDENGDSRLKMPFDEDYVYIIPTAQEKPMKVVFENDKFIWKGEINANIVNNKNTNIPNKRIAKRRNSIIFSNLSFIRQIIF